MEIPKAHLAMVSMTKAPKILKHKKLKKLQKERIYAANEKLIINPFGELRGTI